MHGEARGRRATESPHSIDRGHEGNTRLSKETVGGAEGNARVGMETVGARRATQGTEERKGDFVGDGER